MKAPKFDFAKEKVLLPVKTTVSTNSAEATTSEEKESKENNGVAPLDVAPLIDIEGVLKEVKPADKGKVADEGMEDIEK